MHISCGFRRLDSCSQNCRRFPSGCTVPNLSFPCMVNAREGEALNNGQLRTGALLMLQGHGQLRTGALLMLQGHGWLRKGTQPVVQENGGWGRGVFCRISCKS